MHPERNLKLYEFSSIDPILFSLLVLALVLAGYTNKRVALSPSNNLGEHQNVHSSYKSLGSSAPLLSRPPSYDDGDNDDIEVVQI
ncbi:unnamed protein product [Dracunculus medinensis]|uniref:Ovule protein n=1 Tax=Dracunculus medinensis TaxID=318479 RepID=A0A0N4UIQ6_DRAME|nr:unnamed protein product [Dracunculus medinensis]